MAPKTCAFAKDPVPVGTLFPRILLTAINLSNPHMAQIKKRFTSLRGFTWSLAAAALAFGASVQTFAEHVNNEQIRSLFRTYGGEEFDSELASITGDDVLSSFNDEVLPTLRSQGHSLRDLTSVEASALAAALRAGDFNQFVHTLEGIYGTEGADNAILEYTGFDFRALSRFTPGNPLSSQIQITDSTVKNDVLSQAETKDEKEAKAAQAASIFGLRPVFGGAGFYSMASTGGGPNTDLETIGVNLSAAFSNEKLELRATVPIYHSRFGTLDFQTYGLDLAGKYQLAKGLNVGAHGSFLAFAGDDRLQDNTWIGGPFVSYAYAINDRVTVSAGALFDYVAPDIGQETWIAALAANVGITITDNIVANPYYVYYRDLDSIPGLDEDWHDLGLEFALSINKTWSLTAGGKTTVGYDLFDYAFQVYLGTALRF
jgi:hypothetical protein